MKVRQFVFLSGICAVLLFAQSARPGMAASDAFPQRIAGVWVGSGSIHQAPGAPRERVRCRLSAKWAKQKSSIAIRYICLGIDIKFETTGTLKFNQTRQIIAGKLITVGIGAFSARGKRRGNGVVLSLAGKDKKTGKPVNGTLSISLKGSASLASTLTATDAKTGKRFQAFKARFKK